jgi:tetratricopeptide (TPR) repeat protein
MGQKKLWMKGSAKLIDKKYKKAEKILLKALKAKDNNHIDRHFTYNLLIKLYFQLRDERKDALEKCIHYCKEDIEHLAEFLEAWKEEYGDTSHLKIPAVVHLANIYEKNEKFQKAIDLYSLGLKLGLDDDKEEGFQSKVNRLKKKLN